MLPLCIALVLLLRVGASEAPLQRAYGSTLSEALAPDSAEAASAAASAAAEARRWLSSRLGDARWCAVAAPPPAVERLWHAPDGARRGGIAALRPAREAGAPDEELAEEPRLGAAALAQWRLRVLPGDGVEAGAGATACAAALAAARAPAPPPADGADGGAVADAGAGAGAASTAFDGSCASLPACAALAPEDAADEEHVLGIMVGLDAERDVGVVRHSWTRAPASAAAAAAPTAAATSLRLMSFNLWNVNPPRWLWRSPADRLRQYSFRMSHAGDILRQTSPDVFALQEVRYESTLGGRGPAFDAALQRAEDWYNQTRSIGTNPRYIERNEHWWVDVQASAVFPALVQRHPIESAPPAPTEAGSEAAAANETATAPPPLKSPYARNMARGPADYGAVRAALRRHPHAQVEHVAAHLPGFQFVFRPAQMYLDASRWLVEGEPHRDEEGPAIFSRYPIVHSDALLLSRDAHDDGDSHQRLCLHAVLDIGGGTLVDVFTVHLALSERARNRTVQEIAAFVGVSARGALQLLTGDMNAEPHEPAMRWLIGRLDGELHLADHAPRDGADAVPAAYAAAPPPRICAVREDLYERCAEAEAAVNAEGDIAVPADVAAAAPPAAFTDAFSLAYGDAVAEPVPAAADAAVRRYLFTFPSDNPVKRIDLVLLAAPAGTALRGNGSDTPSSGGSKLAATVSNYYLVGQDALPGTEAFEGRGLGMTAERSPIYASDHRAVVLDLDLEHAH